jgi:hypothetical protein
MCGVIAFSLALPTVLVGGWLAMWLVHHRLRWLWFFAGGLGLMLLTAVIFVGPRHPCQDSGLACVSDSAFIAGLNLFFGFGTWLLLLVVTGLFAAVMALPSAVRPTEGGDDPGGAGEPAEQAVVGGAGAAEPHPIELPDRRDPGRGIP